MKLVYSINCKPALLKRWGVDNQLKDNLYCYTLSILLSQKHFDDIVVYCDSIAYSFLKQLKFKNVQFKIIDFDLPAEQWTSTKLVIYKLLIQENKPFIHIDGDIFLTKQNIVDRLKNFKNVIVQGEDADFKLHYLPTLDIFKSISDIEELDYSYNSGIFGIRDIDFLKKYILEWEKYVDIFYSQKNLIVSKFDPSVFLEQYILTTLLHNKIEHETILGKLNVSFGEEYVNFCNELGYIHLYGDAKYHFYYQDKIKNRLSLDFQNFYKKLNQDIEKSLNSSRISKISDSEYQIINEKKTKIVILYAENSEIIRLEISKLQTIKLHSEIRPIEII